jgi:hypothetical protein
VGDGASQYRPLPTLRHSGRTNGTHNSRACKDYGMTLAVYQIPICTRSYLSRWGRQDTGVLKGLQGIVVSERKGEHRDYIYQEARLHLHTLTTPTRVFIGTRCCHLTVYPDFLTACEHHLLFPPRSSGQGMTVSTSGSA